MSDRFEDDVYPTADGLVQCLLHLSEEAASLSLSRTFAALQDAVAICRAEADRRPAINGGFRHLAFNH